MACPPGFTLSFRGWYSCAVDKKPCATKRERPGMSASECAASCSSCVAVSVYGGRECWMYRELTGDRVYGADSVFCTRDRPLSSTFARLQEFRDVLTVESGGNARVVRSSGGAASGGVVSEGMGYGLLLAGIAAAAEERGSDSWRASLSFGEQLFVGWRRMAESTHSSCQDDDQRALCGGRPKRTGEGPTRGHSACLPAWRFDNQIRKQAGPGSAADADEDALLGLVRDACAGCMRRLHGEISGLRSLAGGAGQEGLSDYTHRTILTKGILARCCWWRRPTRRAGRAGRRWRCGPTRAAAPSSAGTRCTNPNPNQQRTHHEHACPDHALHLEYLVPHGEGLDGLPEVALTHHGSTYHGSTYHGSTYHGSTYHGSAGQVPHGEGRLPRLGSCWGGWDCSNPSYLAPAHYRAFRRYMLRHGARFGSTADEGERAAAQWEALVRASYAMLGEAQCPSTGLTPNWWQPAGPQRSRGRTGCNSSGTDADEFGSEAVRSRWCGSGWCGR